MRRKISMCDETARRAWRVIRLALLWARKGGLLKCRLVSELRHMPKYLKGHHHKVSQDMIRLGERQLSFDETPIIHFRMRRPDSLRFKMPCLKPEVLDFDYDFSDDCGDYEDVGYGTNLSKGGKNVECGDRVVVDEDEGIEDKAEEFIAKFYAQMKIQRQVSFQQRQQTIQAL